MGVRIEVEYQGNLRCAATHGLSGAKVQTDAPKDNQGEGATFSPTDLLAAALGSCMLTVMAISARNRGFTIDGATASVDKEMGTHPRRHVSRLTVRFQLSATLTTEQRDMLEAMALACPVATSLHPTTELELKFSYV